MSISPKKLTLLIASVSPGQGFVSATMSSVGDFVSCIKNKAGDKMPSMPEGFILYQKLSPSARICDLFLCTVAGGLASMSFLHGKFAFCLTFGVLLPYLINALIFFYNHNSSLGDKSIYFALPIFTILVLTSLLESQYYLSKMFCLVFTTIFAEIIQRLYLVSRKREDLLFIAAKLPALLLLPGLLVGGWSLYPIMDPDDLYKLWTLLGFAAMIAQIICGVCNHNYSTLEEVNFGCQTDKDKYTKLLNPLEMVRASLGLRQPLIVAFPDRHAYNLYYNNSGSGYQDRICRMKFWIKRQFFFVGKRLHCAFFPPSLIESYLDAVENTKLCKEYEVTEDVPRYNGQDTSDPRNIPPTVKKTSEEIDQIMHRALGSKACVLVAAQLATLIRQQEPKITADFKKFCDSVARKVLKGDIDFPVLRINALKEGDGIHENHSDIQGLMATKRVEINKQLMSEEKPDLDKLRGMIASYIACQSILTLCSSATVVAETSSTVDDMIMLVNGRKVKSLELLKFLCLLEEDSCRLHLKFDSMEEAFSGLEPDSGSVPWINSKYAEFSQQSLLELVKLWNLSAASPGSRSAYTKGAFSPIPSAYMAGPEALDPSKIDELKANEKLMNVIKECAEIARGCFRNSFIGGKLDPMAVKSLRDVPTEIYRKLQGLIEPKEILPFIRALSTRPDVNTVGYQLLYKLLSCNVREVLELSRKLSCNVSGVLEPV